MRGVPLPRRGALRALLALPAACSVLPERPYQEVQRFALAPRRPDRAPPAAGPDAPVLLLRLVRAAPGMERRGLRSVAPDGRIDVAFWSEWTAAPAELTEEAIRLWLGDAGLFAAVIPPGSRLQADVVMEAELLRLETVAAEGVARAGLSVLLLTDAGRDPQGQARILGQFLPQGTARLPGNGGPPGAAEQAAAMEAALAASIAALERELRRTLAARGPERNTATRRR
jgi:ABC-type uncharacterized transport system auxiliary subunit